MASVAIRTAPVTRYLLKIAYDGQQFSGSAALRGAAAASGVGVQNEIENALKKFTGQSIITEFASRTDSGVHATENAFHFDLVRSTTRGRPDDPLLPYDADSVKNALNAYLCPHVRATCCFVVPQSFHARFSALSRTYVYRIRAGSVVRPLFGDRFLWQLEHKLDTESMHAGAQHLVGTHDFTSFRNTRCQSTTPIRTILKIQVAEIANDIFSPNFHHHPIQDIALVIKANAFLYHQVRIIVGTLMHVGTGKMAPDEIRRLLEQRTNINMTPAPAHALFLTHVDYGPAYGQGTLSKDFALNKINKNV